MLDKCAVAGDITQAIDRRGAWTCAIVIAGGTESTAVKLQSCDTADGSFTDFKTLISASEASVSQYKGFVIDLDGAKKFIKVTGATMATCVLGDCDADVKKVAIKAGEVPSGADLEDNKTATIDVSAYTEPVEVTPTSGKDGMKKATVILSNIPVAGATLYAWKDTRNEIAYTETALPEPGGSCYLSDVTGLASATIKAVAEDEITVAIPEADIDFSRYSDGDIEL